MGPNVCEHVLGKNIPRENSECQEGVRLSEPKPMQMLSVTGEEGELLNLYGVCQLHLSPKPQKTGSYGKQASKDGRNGLSEISTAALCP